VTAEKADVQQSLRAHGLTFAQLRTVVGTTSRRSRWKSITAAIAVALFALPLYGTISTRSESVEPTRAFGTKIIDISLSFDETAIESLKAAPDADVPGKMSTRAVNGADETYDVTIRIKGGEGSKRTLDGKPAFKVKLDKDQRFLGLQQLTLNNMVQDKTMVHEALGYQVYEAAGVKVPETGYARVSVNGEPYGLYLNLETIDAQFLRRQFGTAQGILYEGSYGVDLRATDAEKFQLHEGTDPNRAQLKALIRAVESPGDDVFYGTPALVDTGSFLAMMATGALIEDWDNYYSSNNYRIYWDPSASRWVFIPTGIDQTFVSNSTGVFGATGLLFQKCLASERCVNQYAATVRDIAGRFEGLGLTARVDALLAMIGAASDADPKKTFDDERINGARDRLRGFIARRPNEVRTALSCLDGGRERAIGACAGLVALNSAVSQCLEVVPDDAPRNGGGISVAPCAGGPNQRWHLTATGDAFELVSAKTEACLGVADARQDDGAPLKPSPCGGTDNQLFSLGPLAHDISLVARHSGKCVALAPGHPTGAALIQVTCMHDAAQTWRVERSIYH
jgi:hypothetical protein